MRLHLPRPLAAYETFVFDCDGVLLDSNRIKTEAFYAAALCFGSAVAEQFVSYHKANGGVSRQEKFHYLFANILNFRNLPEADYHQALSVYGEQVRIGLERCSIAPGVRDLLEQLPAGSRRYVVSGGAQDEVRWVLELKKLSTYFDGIYGNPTDKLELVKRLDMSQAMPGTRLYFGDARYDHEVARAFNMDFVFVSGLSEFSGWSEYCHQNKLQVIEWLSQVVPR